MSGDAAVPARAVRVKAFEVLARDSESLSERNFERILKDAHDQEVVDLRRRGNDYEVSLPAAVAPVSEQLNRAAAAHAASVAAAAPVTPVAPRGMVPRSAPPRGGGRRTPSGPPPELLLVGVVDDVRAPIIVESTPGAAKPSDAPALHAAPAKRSGSRGGGVKAKNATATGATAKGPATKTALAASASATRSKAGATPPKATVAKAGKGAAAAAPVATGKKPGGGRTTAAKKKSAT